VAHFPLGNNSSRMYREVGVKRMPHGLRHIALSISSLSPMSRRPDALFAMKMASLIFLPDVRFLALSSFHSNLKTAASNEREAIGPLRQRMLDDMNMRRSVPDTQREYIRAVKKLASFLGRSPDSAAC
jgi:hypothetical protein